jgi:hypothetical protein
MIVTYEKTKRTLPKKTVQKSYFSAQTIRCTPNYKRLDYLPILPLKNN